MDKEIHTVFGKTGKYSDITEWAVCSFFDEEKAKERVLLAAERAAEIEQIRPDKYVIPDGVVNEYDLGMQMDHTGTDYYYITTCILDS